LVELLLLVALGCAVGVYGTIVGLGGGFVLVPLLLILYPGYSPETVTSISLAVVCANAVSGSVAYAFQHRIDYWMGLLFAACSIPGVILGAYVVQFVPGRLFSLLFAGILVAAAGLLIRSQRPTVREPLRGGGVAVRTLTTADGLTFRYGFRIWQGVTFSAAIGFVSTLFGIGGGVVQLPVMITLFRIPVMIAVATALFVLTFMAGGGTAIHAAAGTLAGEPLQQAAALALGAVVGAQGGAWLSRRIPVQWIVWLLMLALVALAVRLAVQGVFGY
jgi:uncharacterized membrane protein YfcA